MNEPEPRGLGHARADASAGATASARHRLKGLIASQPANLLARAYLAHLYRLDGYADEAGRWGYFDAATTAVERASYAHSCVHRRGKWFPMTSTLNGLHWPADVEAPNPDVAAILTKLREGAAAEAAAGQARRDQALREFNGSIWTRSRAQRKVQRAMRRWIRRNG